jgi:DNA-binding NarL/FixJ family response regulator
MMCGAKLNAGHAHCAAMAPGPPFVHAFLVVDDNMDVRAIVGRLIRRSHPDAFILTACDAADALGRLEGAGPGRGLLVISDYDMGPGMLGTQLLEEIAKRHPQATRVLLTGHEPDRIPPAACEVHALIPKDAGFQALQTHLRALAGASEPVVA